jgi:Na+(H+)/acetate symporter ActP
MEWSQVIMAIVIIAANLTTMILLYIHLDRKTSDLVNAIQDEMRDFHSRLCAIEERNKK